MTMTMTFLYTETRRHRGYFDDDVLSPLVRGGSKAGIILTEHNPLRQSRSVTDQREVKTQRHKVFDHNDDLFIEHRKHEMTQKINRLNDRRWCSAPYVSGRIMPLES